MGKHLSITLAIVSTLGMICWMITDFFGGMIIYLLSYAIIIIPLVVLYIISFFETIISAIKRGINVNKVKVIFHGFLLLTIVLFNVLQSDIFKSKRILTATLKDDLFHHKLILRENGNCENEVSGAFGFHEVFYGKYKLYGDTIIFEKVPYDNGFIPDTLLIDRIEKAIFIDKDETGKFYTKKQWLNHFSIH